jgi:hypothetical protein
MSDISLSRPMMKQNFWAGITVFAILGILIFGGSPWTWTDKSVSEIEMEQSSSPTQ